MRSRQALRQAVDKLHSSAASPSSSWYCNLVRHCVHLNDVEQAKRLQSHLEAHPSSDSRDLFVKNRLLHLYSKSGNLALARDLFDGMPLKDVSSYNALLSALSRAGLIPEMWELFCSMESRDAVSYNTTMTGFVRSRNYTRALGLFVGMLRDRVECTDYGYVSAINACAQARRLKCGKQVHQRILITGSLRRGNVFVGNAVCDMYMRCGEIGMAAAVFDGMASRSVVSWNSMISGYLSAGMLDKCFQLFCDMRDTGIEPDQVTISNVLGAYFQVGDFNEARRIFAGTKERDKVLWTTMMSGYSQNGMEEEALLVFKDMLTKGIEIDSFSMSCAISCCAKSASLCLGQAIHGKVIVLGSDANLLVSSSIVTMYGYAQNGLDLEAVNLYKKMLEEKVKPDDITFTAVLSACVHANLIEQGQMYFESISQVHGAIPSSEHYASMINLHGQSGEVTKALDLINGMPHKPNYVIWSALLSACASNNDIEHAEVAARNLFDLDPLYAGPYIILSNMYASHGRWKDMASVRFMMKERNVKKLTAFSWIEFDSKVHKFISGDRSHPETDALYEELQKLIAKLSDAGYTADMNSVLHDLKDDEKVASISYHSEKLALAYSLLKRPDSKMPIRILKNIRVCSDCHVFMKYASKVLGRVIVLRDYNRYHHFEGGKCSCKDTW
ncbi:hypothetical protein MLD38_005699 [Melastoma candidum]|uniref:Uncharacterized protein n=1 Tax=Melastoma candidum TaxID=119954 RepID=A0ACB9RKI5_9MYRT|nr:hypothetical protein MLD38_005699 [Melastoma candidum]